MKALTCSSIILFLQCVFLHAQESKLLPTHNYNISNGLAHNGVTSIIEDSKGYVWIGTYDGINKYDGYSFVTYKNSYDNEIIRSNRVRALCEDSAGNIWIGTDNGISLYHYKTDKFIDVECDVNQKSSKKIIVRSIYENKDNNLIICSTEGNGIFTFSTDYQCQQHIIPQEQEPRNNIITYNCIELDSLNYIFCTSRGMSLYNVRNQSFNSVFEQETRGNANIQLVSDSIIAIPLLTGVSFVKYDLVDKEYIFELLPIQTAQHQFNSVNIDAKSNLWLGTSFNGIRKINNVGKLMNHNAVETAVFKGESGLLRVSCIYCSETSGCWVGSFNKGIYRFSNNGNVFKTVDNVTKFSKGLQTNSISNIHILDDKRVLLSANRGGVAAFNTESHQFESLPFKLSEKERKNIAIFYIDSENCLWYRAHEDAGLSRVNLNNGKQYRIDYQRFPELQSLRPRICVEDKFGNIWIGEEKDVYKIRLDENGDVDLVESLNSHSLFKHKPIDQVRALYLDPQYNYIWVGTGSNGLVRIEPQKNTSVEYLKVEQFLRDKTNNQSISSNFVSAIVRTPNGELWIGTEGGGICKVVNSNNTPEFIAFTEKQGLSNNVIKSINYDDEYNLWVATNIGLNKFNTKDYQFRNFKKEDGLPFEDFWYVNAKLKNGNFVFSGVEGFCYFTPSSINSDQVLPKLELENFSVFNKRIAPGDTLNKRVLLNERLNDAEEIVLAHNENSISFIANVLHFSAPENHYLQYQLLPINKQWIQVSSDQRSISYNDLNPGNYQFRVKASNSLNEWTKTKELNIIVKPPFWKTIPAMLIYLLCLLSIIYIVIKVITRIQKLQHKLELEHLEYDKVKEVNAAKLRFFSNISHEIKTPITLISGPINILSNRFKGIADVTSQLQIVQRQSKKISQLIDQVHDFQRSDANMLEMHYAQYSITDYLKELIKDFYFLAKNDKKQFNVIGIEQDIYVSADRDKVDKIVNNLLSNAFKYTLEGDSISIEFKTVNNDLSIIVKDTGRGIEKSDLPYIFDRFYQSKNKHAEYTGGSGIGLAFSLRLAKMHYGDIKVESEVNTGSTFSVHLPIVVNASNKQQEEVKEKALIIETGNQANDILTDKMDVSQIKVDASLSEAILFYAEDNTEMRQFVEGVLSQFFTVKSFVNGKDCLNAMEKEWPDLVVSDILMPELNGFDLCKSIKTDIKTSHIPVLLLTACTSIEDEIKGLDFGADAYVKKPFNIQYLISTCESLLRSRKQLRERFKHNLPLDLSNLDEEENSQNKVFLEKFYELIEKNLDNADIDLATFAKELYLNRTHFFQKVKAITNQTPYELIKSYRIKKAAELLVEKRLPVNDVFLMTGFKSRAHFNKLFKEKYELPPGKYASQMKKAKLVERQNHKRID